MNYTLIKHSVDNIKLDQCLIPLLKEGSLICYFTMSDCMKALIYDITTLKIDKTYSKNRNEGLW